MEEVKAVEAGGIPVYENLEWLVPMNDEWKTETLTRPQIRGVYEHLIRKSEGVPVRHPTWPRDLVTFEWKEVDRRLAEAFPNPNSAPVEGVLGVLRDRFPSLKFDYDFGWLNVNGSRTHVREVDISRAIGHLRPFRKSLEEAEESVAEGIVDWLTQVFPAGCR